jgi:hypothetical protein
MGNFSYFFFAAHLLDIAVVIPTLKTILQSVTHNGKQVRYKLNIFNILFSDFKPILISYSLKQLVLTVMLLIIVVYIYTVIAFNFFRKFYVQEEDDQVDQKCHNMLTVSKLFIESHFWLQNNYLNFSFVVFCLSLIQRCTRWRWYWRRNRISRWRRIRSLSNYFRHNFLFLRYRYIARYYSRFSIINTFVLTIRSFISNIILF